MWSVLHVLWSAIYVTSGAAQLVAGIFFLLALPSLILACNLLAGIWNILLGITVGMVACCGQISPKRQESLLYIIISILIVNTVNVIITEWGFYIEDLPKLLQKHQYHTLVQYASFATRVAGGVVIVVSFLDSQLTFCSMHTTASNSKKKLRGSHEQVSDIEYIIPRPKSTKPQVQSAYTQSWVFEAENAAAAAAANAKSESPYLKLSQDGTPKRSPKKTCELENGTLNDTTYLIDNPMVHIEEASDDSTSNSDRKLGYMKSFSRSASPGVLSASSSLVSLNRTSVPIYDCLEKLTQPETFRSRLNSALSNKDEPQYQMPQAMVRRSDTTSPQLEQVQYASLMKELQSAIVGKKEPRATSPPSNNSSNSKSSSSRHDSSRSDAKNSDVEFSKELEAALQLIQDLESPNTVDTPSDAKQGLDKDGKPMAVWRNSRSDSEKTLSAVGSIAEIGSPHEFQPDLYTFKPPTNGKSTRIIVQCSDSQSTSGYSSPTHNKSTLKCWSTTSSLNGSNHDLGKPLSYSIHNTKSTAVISLFASDTLQSKEKSVTLVNISGDNLPIHEPLHNTLLTDYANNNFINEVENDKSTRSSTSPNLWNVKSLLRKKKQNLPKLCPELEGAIVKSESLAYLTELELLARHQRNKDIHRQIEQRVQQQLGTPWTDND